ncbi:hypothetical protein [Roseateles puraquae]|uniref:Uncharacterized protein n=1 Tax=Roseateles puraquae TaxID=431059 RepID=A0A254NB58_9BURK|nr:hypothetical protein [Roseateles puraquae]MDG0856194.1 hypothetical protein [Roseateles puraquae]OWR04854.1 hypothetical protein CDO81_09810 [Roseateles puraquae]
MFVSQPEFEFPFPPGLTHPGSQHWRVVELTLHAPWFLLSVEIADGEHPDCRITRTLCIAWDTDLAELVSTMEPNRVKGIVCMMPAWQSATGQWTSREISEVWRCRSATGHSIALVDTAGERFDGGMVSDHEQPIERDLVLRIEPTKQRQRHRTIPSRRTRRAKARKVSA